MKRVSERLKEIKRIEKRIQQDLLCEIAKTAIRSYNSETKTIDTREITTLIAENWDFLARKYKPKKKNANNIPTSTNGGS